MARSSAQNQALRQSSIEAILNAAVDLFGRQGYQATSMAAIAERAGISKGLAYHYFPAKLSILASLLETQQQRFREMLEPLAAVPPEQRLAAWVLQTGELVANNRAAMRLLVGLLFSETPEVAQLLAQQKAQAQAQMDREFQLIGPLFQQPGDFLRLRWALLGLTYEFLADADEQALQQGLTQLLNPGLKEP
ncbi:MAG: helix-turn-helix domain-containing protein [bacterium]|nr:helix-turn-helix domain-containing protein [bacterium]